MLNNNYLPSESRRDFLKLIGKSTTSAALLTGCAVFSATNPSSPSVPLIYRHSNNTLPQKKTTTDMSLASKIGQMLMVGFRGLTINDPVMQDIRDRHIGGVILFDYDVPQKRPMRNIQSPGQVRKLVRALQDYAEIPLLIGIDYEGGIINRLKERYGFPPTVSHEYLGTQNNLSLTYQYASQMAKTLATMGINLNFAPVVDLNVNPDNPIIGQKERSFSANPTIVSEQALEFIKAHHQQGVLCTLKHFPGHGSSTNDSHLGLVDVTDSWSKQELIPYENLILKGQVDAVMTGHIFNKHLDKRYPATLSKPIITGLLRQELNYRRGVVFSDDLQMKAIAHHYGLKTAVQKAIEAGVDIILIGNNLDVFVENIATQVTDIIKQLVADGTISSARIDESYQRIQLLKSKIPV
jgi:beta-N-acetylhexosaminidase